MQQLQSEANASDSEAGKKDFDKRLVRSCEKYKEEYDECRSSKSRRHQIFVHGEVLDCSQWETDFQNCIKYTWDGDDAAGFAISESERQRLRARLIPHLGNKVWEKRDGPPADWNKPLPTFEKQNKNSYLNLIKEQGEEAVESCVIQ